MSPLILIAIHLHLALALALALAAYDYEHDCPLHFPWANFSSAAALCTDPDPSQLGTCCRYLNAYVAISVARYANSTGNLGVPPAFSDLCLSSVSQTFRLSGIPQAAAESCGVGPKIRVTYQCDGRTTVLQMMQSPGFTDVVSNCQLPLSSQLGCKTCLNSGILYLHRLIGSDDNVALSVCRDALFATLSNQGDTTLSLSADHDDMASCFFGVQGLLLTTNSNVPSQPRQPSSPNVVSAPAPTPIRALSGPHSRRHSSPLRQKSPSLQRHSPRVCSPRCRHSIHAETRRCS